MSAEISKVTELDFENIKSNLKDYFQREDSPFRDWNFEGSGLNYLLDILAYNTHYNAVNAHVSMNESFLDSAQIRSNVVSRAKLIGYTPRSRRGAVARLNITFARNPASTVVNLTLPRGSRFTASFDDTTYVFTTLNDSEATYDSTIDGFQFSDVEINQGVLDRLRFLVDTSNPTQKYLIDDETIDTSTLIVRVFDHQQTTNATTFLPRESFNQIDSDSRVYFLSENFEGKYQVEFGDGTIGRKLENLNVVELVYLTTSGAEANGTNVFTFETSGDSVFASATNEEVISINTISSASGGDERESVESIRRTAPYAYIAQNRGVTTNDYEALIRENIPNIEALSIWGGQYNDPPIYGKVFLSAKPKDDLFLSSVQRQQILDYLESVNVLTVKPEIVDPNYIFLFFDVFFSYNRNRTTLSETQLESKVRNSIINFNSNFLEDFDKVFRYSNFLRAIDNSDEAILNSFARIFVLKTVDLVASNRTPFNVDFQFELFGDIDEKDSLISSSSWTFNNQDYFLADEPIEGETVNRRLFVYRLSNDLSTQIKVIPNAGILNIKTGRLALEPLPTTFNTQINITARPNSYDVATIRNQLLSIDLSRTTITGNSDPTVISSSSGGTNYQPISRFRT